jgi:DNA-binding response OmpR family regulator
VIAHERDASGSVVPLLEAAGYQCLCSSGAQSAWECVRKATPDLIISDINLAGQSGVALCEELKHSAQLADVPVMFFSATQIPDIIRRSHAAGTYYLRKPCDPDVLLELIDKALEWSQRTTAGAPQRN